MMQLLSLLTVAMTAISGSVSASTTSTSTTTTSPAATVVVPLYIYPTAGAWNTLYTSLSANPLLKFLVIVNPASGPGDANSFPNSDYISAIATLRTYQNAIPLCYVHTSYATRPIADVLTDITTCANWRNYTASDIHMSGIFFDEAVYDYNSTTIAYMTQITNFARSSLGTNNNSIVYNPGTVVPSQWYTLADYVVAFENSYSAYSSAVINSIGAAQRAQSVFIVYSVTGGVAAQTSLVNAVAEGGVGGLFVTDQSGYTSFSGIWAQFCAAVGKA